MIKKKKNLILTGGGTAGHVTPHIPVIKKLVKGGYTPVYIGSEKGIEKNIIKKENIPFYSISTGKLRRYFDFNNFFDIFRILIGLFQSVRLILKINPAVVFSKGGFVSCPVVWAAWICRIPVIIHESDISPGLANRLCLPFCKKVCYSFAETKQYLPVNKSVYTGIPIRNSLLYGSKQTGKSLCGFDDSKPIILIIGGSSGSVQINSFIRSVLSDLLPSYQICHICGYNNIMESLNYKGYKQFEFVDNDLKHLLAMTDIVVSRSGATSIFEILALKKLNLLIPLSIKVSRGDQVLNARSFNKSGFSLYLEEDDLSVENFLKAIIKLKRDEDKFYNAMENKNVSGAETRIIEIINEYFEK